MAISGRETINSVLVDNKYGDVIVHNLVGTSAATSGNYDVFVPAFSTGVEILEVSVRFSAASSSGTLQINRVPDGTAAASGSAILATTISTAGATNTTVTRTAFNAELTNERVINRGDGLAIVSSGTLTGLQNLSIAIYYRPLGRGDYR